VQVSYNRPDDIDVGGRTCPTSLQKEARMALFSKGQAQRDAQLREYVQPMLLPGEEVAGIVMATQSSAFKNETFVVCVTNQRLIMIPAKANLTPKGDPTFITPEEILSTSIAGHNETFMDFVKLDDSNIRFETASRKYKLDVYSSGGLDRMFAGKEQAAGSQAFYEFLVALGR
jgi:hypothetical protein